MNELNEVFEIEPVKTEEQLPTLISETKKLDPIDETLIQDFTTSRDNVDAIMDMGRTALQKVLEIAQEGQHPRFYEAAALLIKNLSDANFQYMEIHEKVSRIRKNNADSGHEDSPKISIEKAIFTGTTADLLKQVNPRKVIDVK